MKQVLDKVILSIFYILCLIAFFALIEQLPILISHFFDININGFNLVIFFLLAFIIGYVVNYYSNENNKNKILEQNKLQAIKNIYSFDYSNLKIIQKIELSEFNKIHFILKNGYNIYVELETFKCINTPKLLEELDNFINTLKYEVEEQIVISIKYERDITEYLIKQKKN